MCICNRFNIIAVFSIRLSCAAHFKTRFIYFFHLFTCRFVCFGFVGGSFGLNACFLCAVAELFFLGEFIFNGVTNRFTVCLNFSGVFTSLFTSLFRCEASLFIVDCNEFEDIGKVLAWLCEAL